MFFLTKAGFIFLPAHHQSLWFDHFYISGRCRKELCESVEVTYIMCRVWHWCLLLVQEPALGTDPLVFVQHPKIPFSASGKWFRRRVLLWALCRVGRVEEDKEWGRGFLWCLSSSPSLCPEWRFPQPAATESPLGADFPSLLYSEVRSQQMSAFHTWLCLTHSGWKCHL